MPLHETCLHLLWAGFFEVDVQGVAVDLSYFAIAKFLVEDALADLKICRHCFFRNDFAFDCFGSMGFGEIGC